jgi:hypothetical protein
MRQQNLVKQIDQLIAKLAKERNAIARNISGGFQS